MKNLLFSFLAMAFVFTSCSTEESITEQTDTNSKLKSFEITRNADGSYALVTNVSDGVGTAFYDDTVANEVHLFSDNNQTKNVLTHNYDIVKEQLSITFVDENTDKNSSITIFDDNTETLSKTEDFGLLNTYSISTNEDGTIELNFEVKNGVNVAFGYNDNEAINDIYLDEDASATQHNYSKSFSREDDGSLRIDFVQSINTSKTDDADTKKPRVIIEGAEDDDW